VLAGKGALRRAKTQRALACCAPFWLPDLATGGSGGNTIRDEFRFKEPNGLLATKSEAFTQNS
jgi:hypothetical protein